MTLFSVLKSEFVKLPRSNVVKVSILGLMMGLLNGLLFLKSQQAIHTWQGMNAWHVLWTTFLSPLTIALFAGLTAQREKHARGGGTWWRPVSFRKLRVAEFTWLFVLILITNAFVVLLSLPFGLIARLPGSIPAMNLVSLVVVLGITSFAILAIQLKISHRFGLIASMLVGFTGTIIGALLAEKSLWWICPWSWPVRATLALTGTHANGIPLASGDLVWQISLWPILILSVLIAVIVFLIPDIKNDIWVVGDRAKSKKVTVSYRSGVFASELVKQRHTLLPWISLATPIMFGLFAFWRHSPINVWQGWALLVVPFGAALVASIAWAWEKDAWRTLRARPISIERIYFVKLEILWLYALGSGLLLALITILIGAPFSVVATLFIAQESVSFMLLALYLFLAIRFGAGLTLGTGIFFTLFAVIFGGSGLGEGIWPFFPWVWGWIPPRLGFTVPFTLLAILFGVLLAWTGSREATKFK